MYSIMMLTLISAIVIIIQSIFWFILKRMAVILPPMSVGFVPNPNLVLPVYIQTEVVQVQDPQGEIWNIRRARPPSVISGAQVVLQCDRDLLARYYQINKENSNVISV